MIISLFFFFNDTATTEIYTLSLHDALPICGVGRAGGDGRAGGGSWGAGGSGAGRARDCGRSEEHTSELQSRLHLVCRLLLEKKKKAVFATSITFSHIIVRVCCAATVKLPVV